MQDKVLRGSPKSQSKSLPSTYWDGLANIWDKNIQNPKSFLRVAYFEADLWISKVISGKRRVLEVGCGTGGSTAVHCSQVQHLVATDLSPDMVRRAHANLSGNRKSRNVRFTVADVTQLPFSSESYDAVYGRGVALSYAPDASVALRQIRRVLKPGGVLAIDVMNLRPTSMSTYRWKVFQMMGRTPVYQEVKDDGRVRTYNVFDIRPGDPWIRYCRAGKKVRCRPKNLRRHTTRSYLAKARYFTPQEITAIVQAAGFREVTVHPLGHLYYAQVSEKPWMRKFWREHAEDLSRFITELEPHVRTETAIHLLVTARKPRNGA